jgi:drug/metabolite transporter (DMT)-like permease
MRGFAAVAAVVLALCSALSFGIADFFGGLATKRLRVLVVLVVSQTTGLVAIAILVAIRGDGPPDAAFVPYALVSAALGVVGLMALYRGLAIGMMSVVAPIAATASVVAVLFGAVTGERPAALQNLGLLLALGGVVLVSLAPAAGNAGAGLAAGAGLGIAAAACFGLFLILFDRAAEDDPYWATLVLRIGSVSLLLLALAVVRPSKPFAFGAATLVLLMSVGLLDAAGNAFFAVASTKGLVGVVAVLSSLYPVGTVALARVVLGERLTAVQATGVLCAFTGVALIAAG